MAFKGKDGTWKGGNNQSQGSVVYGKSGDSWLYAKSAWAKKDGSWQRAWTDCRQHDAGGRDWIVAPGVTETQYDCGNRQSRIRTDYSKDGCTSYSRYTAWVSAPDCSGCFTPSAVECYGCGSSTTYNANPGSNCTSYTVGSCGTWAPASGPIAGFTYTGFYGYYTRPSYSCICPENDPCYFPYQETVYIAYCSVGGTSISSVGCDCYFGCGA